MRLIVAALVAALPAVAQAQQNCAPMDAIIARLAERYAEAQVFAGLSEDGQMTTLVYLSAGGSWTAVTTRAGSGIGCLVAAGVNGEVTLPPAAPIPGSLN